MSTERLTGDVMLRDSNNEHGTRDHDTSDGREFLTGKKRVIRWEHSKHGEARYYIEGGQPGKCCGYISGDVSGGHQCYRNAKYDYRGHKFCGTHYPPKVFERAQKREEKWRRKWQAEKSRWDYQKAMREWKERVITAFEEIAKGELNDPAGYAAMILDEKPILDSHPPASDSCTSPEPSNLHAA